jgi:hypothetical protein
MLGLAGVLALTPALAAETFTIKIENLSPNVLTPVPFISHNGSFNLFDGGSAASSAVEVLAEDGVPSDVEGLAVAAQGAGDVLDYAIAFGPGAPPVLPPGTSVTVNVDADLAHPWLSYLSMLAISNDAFIGGAAGDGAIDLFPGGNPLVGSFVLTHLDVWDAGTEVNDELAAHVPALGAGLDAGVAEGGVITRPHPGLLGVGDIPGGANWIGGDVARITITPEPASVLLVALGGLAICRRRRGAVG